MPASSISTASLIFFFLFSSLSPLTSGYTRDRESDREREGEGRERGVQWKGEGKPKGKRTMSILASSRSAVFSHVLTIVCEWYQCINATVANGDSHVGETEREGERFPFFPLSVLLASFSSPYTPNTSLLHYSISYVHVPHAITRYAKGNQKAQRRRKKH
jgi:hypothetical protein